MGDDFLSDIIDRLNYYKKLYGKTYDDLSSEIRVSRRSLIRWLKGQVKPGKIQRKHRQKLWRYWRGLPESLTISAEHTMKMFEKTYDSNDIDYSVWTHPTCLRCECFPDSCKGTGRDLTLFKCYARREKKNDEK